jgi:quercetin dioxygenase-like cupin family protein
VGPRTGALIPMIRPRRVDIDPEFARIRHVHPGEAIIYVLEWSLKYQIDGQPTKV